MAMTTSRVSGRCLSTSGDYNNPVVDQWRRFQNWYRTPAVDPGISIDTVVDPDMTHTCLDVALPGCVTRCTGGCVTAIAVSVGVTGRWRTTFQVGRFHCRRIRTGSPPMLRSPRLQYSTVAVVPLRSRPIPTTSTWAAPQPSVPATSRAINSTTTFDPGLLDEMTGYFWRIDSHLGSQVTEGPTWSFTTDLNYPTQFTYRVEIR